MTAAQTKDILKHELIGLEGELIDSKVGENVGLKGKIVNETRNTLTIQTNRGKKILLKKNITIKIKNFKIKGSLLIGRPEERIKFR